MSSITGRLTAAFVTLAAALFVGSVADAHAATYWQVFNAKTGRALEATVGGNVKLATPNSSNQAQQWKWIKDGPVGGFYEAAIQNRLVGECLRSDSDGSAGVAPLKLGLCGGASSEHRLRWIHKSGSQTGTPTVAGDQLINKRSGEFIGEEFCFIVCGSVPLATLWGPAVVASDPQQAGASLKWKYKLVATAP